MGKYTKTMLVVSLLTVLGAYGVLTQESQGGAVSLPVAYRVHSLGNAFSGTEAKGSQVIVIRTPEDVDRLRATLMPERLPSVDASLIGDEVLILFVAGEKNSTGHELIVAGISRKKQPDALVVQVRELAPRGLSDPAITYPYTLISVSRKEFVDVIECVGEMEQEWPAAIHMKFRNP